MDAEFSLDPKEFTEMVQQVRDAEKAMGRVNYNLSEKQRKTREIAGRSLFAAKDIKKGEELTYENVRSVRPGYGFHPCYLPELIGAKASRVIEKGQPMEWRILKVN